MPTENLFGTTRSTITSRYALITPESFVPVTPHGWQDAACVTVIAPQMGAGFTQRSITLAAGGGGGGSGSTEGRELFWYVEQGSVTIAYNSFEYDDITDENRPIMHDFHELATGGYCYLPPGYAYSIRAAAPDTRLVLFERHYAPHPEVLEPDPLVGHEQEVPSAPFMGDAGAQLKLLLPDDPAFDMAVNVFTFEPGTALPLVEMHIMEHGLRMLQGQGIYRLGNDWHPVQAGDVIWMAAYCPQWFVAMGKTPARYLYYKDVNRDPRC